MPNHPGDPHPRNHRQSLRSRLFQQPASDEGVAGFLIIQDENRGGPDVEGTLEPAQAAQIRPMLMCSPAWRRRLPRTIARQEGDQIRLWSRNGRDWSAELVAITAALRGLPADLYWTARR